MRKFRHIVAAPLTIAAISAGLAGCASGGLSGAGYSVAPKAGVSGQAPDVSELGQGAGSLKVVDTLPPPMSSSGGTSQVIVPSDVLEVNVFEVDNLNRVVQVDAAGQISIPLVGTIAAAGKTLPQLEIEIEHRYGAKYLQNPDVSVFMKESVGQRVTVDGEFSKAGIYPTTANMSLLQVIALAGNFSPVGDPSKVFVYRRYGNDQLVAQFNVEQIRNGRQPDPQIYGGDVVVAFPSGMKILGSNLKEALGIASGASILF